MQHEQRFGAAGAAKILLAPGEANLQYLNKSRLKLREAPYVRSTAALRVAMRLRRELETFDPFASLAIEGLALELIAIFGRAGTPASHAPPSWLRNVRAFLEEDLSRRLSLEGIAAEAGRHPVHVAREFRRYYGCTAGEYLRQLRADKAAGLLRATQMPLTEVALCCGYSDSAQLSRSFRAAFGTTPSTYRRLTR
jgi:AraC family transcriptional regulator